MLVEFASAVDAVTCAVELQEKMAERAAEGRGRRIQFRVGINIGDIIIDGDDIFGDGVNVAARIENECEPGSVCLSGGAFEQVRGKTNFMFDDLGERALKNIDRPVRLYAAGAGTPSTRNPKSSAEPKPTRHFPARKAFHRGAAIPEHERRSEQEYLLMAWSKTSSRPITLQNIVRDRRNSSFTYKGRAVDMKQVGANWACGMS
jgi:adenylate cyclase